MTFADKSKYDRIFQQVTHEGGERAMNYIKIFQRTQHLSVSVGNSYSEYQLMHTFPDNFHQGEKYSAQISSHQVELLSHPYRLIILIWTEAQVLK